MTRMAPGQTLEGLDTPVADVLAFVREFRDRSLTPGLGRISDIAQVAPAPGGDWIAFTGTVHDSLRLPARHAVQLVRVATGEVTEVGGTGGAQWSSDGSLLAYIDGASTVTVLAMATLRRHSFRLPGIVEYLRFGFGTTRLLAGVADHGADRSGAEGSGGLPAADTEATAHAEGGTAGWRKIWQVDAADEAAVPVQASPAGCNAWEADWCAAGVVAIACDLPDEGSWYASRIVCFDGPDSAPELLTRADDQLGLLCSSPEGRAIAYVEAICSDRGVIAGNAHILDLGTGRGWAVDSAGVDITSLAWRDDGTLLASGQRHLDTVVGEISRDGAWRELWTSADLTCGSWYPDAAPVDSAEGHAFAVALHGYGRPPVLTVVTPSGEHPLVDTAHEGTRFVHEVGGALTAETWRAPDGLDIEGLLATPSGRTGPHPLVILIHGGPVSAYRPSWQLIYGWTPLLVAAGYAVLHVNPRGSGGRGQEFAALVRGDMGGADTYDFTSAVDALAGRGLIDPARVAVTGRSYGGYMASWLVTQDDRFAAAVPMAPVTDWFSQHFTSNLGPFDESFLADRVSNPAGRFFSRSPVFFAERVRAPVLSITGGKDRCTPPSQAVEFHRALSEHGRDSTLVVYPTEGHHIESPVAVEDLLVRLLAFLASHMSTSEAAARGITS